MAFTAVKSVTGHVDDAAVYSLGLTVWLREHTHVTDREGGEISMNGISGRLLRDSAIPVIACTQK